MEETYIVILIIAILILILYYVNFSDSNREMTKGQVNKQMPVYNQYKPYNPTENFINSNNTAQITESTQAILKVHIAYWCGWSKKLLQQLESDDFKNKFNDIKNICVLEIIDCDANKEKCNPTMVKGFPTIILQSKSGKMIPYNGDRTTDDIITFIKTNSL
jgi:hypothetical protein